jgi:hypothetical protein
VVERLLEAYSGGVKVREGRKSRLPLHLAARQEDSTTTEVITLLMSYYPEATMSKDGNGLRPVEYALKAAESNKKFRSEIIAAFEMGQKWIRVGQNVTLRLEEDFTERLRSLEKDFGRYVESLKAIHDEKIARIANDLLDAGFNRKLMAAELKKEREEHSGMDVKLRAKLNAMVDRHDRFPFLMEQSRLHGLDLAAATEPTSESHLQTQGKEADFNTTVQSQARRIAELEDQLAEVVRMQELSALSDTEDRETLIAKISALEKSQRMKAGLIKRITSMAQENRAKSQAQILELVNVINEQQCRLDVLISKLELYEAKVHVSNPRST